MLPNDVARCIGATVGNTYQLRLECLNCRRRTAPRAEVVVWRDPPTEHPCPERIAPCDVCSSDNKAVRDIYCVATCPSCIGRHFSPPKQKPSRRERFKRWMGAWWRNGFGL